MTAPRAKRGERPSLQVTRDSDGGLTVRDPQSDLVVSIIATHPLAPVQSPFTRRALAGQLPPKVTRLNIYIVAAPKGARWCVVARSAQDAARVVGDAIARRGSIDRATVDTSAYDVGRLGKYEPGMSGDRLALQSWPVLVG